MGPCSVAGRNDIGTDLLQRDDLSRLRRGNPHGEFQLCSAPIAVLRNVESIVPLDLVVSVLTRTSFAVVSVLSPANWAFRDDLADRDVRQLHTTQRQVSS
jgi:hypothetical protein